MNLFAFTGNVGQDATLRYTPNSKAVCQFSVGVSSGYGDNRKTIWARCSIWDKQAEMASEAFKKGSKFSGIGEIVATSYTDKEGTEKPSLEIRVISFDLPPRDKNDSGNTGTIHQQNNAPQSARRDPMEDLEDSPLPF